MSEIDNKSENMEQPTTCTPLVDSIEKTDTEKPVASKPELEKNKHLKLTEETDSVKLSSKAVGSETSLDTEANIGEESLEAVQTEDDITQTTKEFAQSASSENPNPILEVPFEIPQIAAAHHIESPLNFDNESNSETVANIESVKESPKSISEEFSENNSDQLISELELAPVESNNMETSENVEDENIADEGVENIESIVESSKIVSEESVDTISAKLHENMEISTMELIESNEDSSKVISEQSSESTTHKLTDEPEIFPMKLTESIEENSSIPKDVNKETGEILLEEPLETSSDKIAPPDLAKSNKAKPENKAEISGIEHEIQTTEDLKDGDKILTSQSLDSSKQEAETLAIQVSNVKESKVVLTLDTSKKETEELITETCTVSEKGNIDLVVESSVSSKVEAKDNLDKENKERIETSKKESEVIGLQTSDLQIVALETSLISSEKETNVLVTESSGVFETKDVVLESSDSSKVEVKYNLDRKNEESTESSKVDDIEKAPNSTETLEPMDTYDSQESLNLIIDETSNIAENKDESSEVDKIDKESKMDVDQNDDNTASVKNKTETKKSTQNTTGKEITKEDTKNNQEISKKSDAQSKDKDLQTTEKSEEKKSSGLEIPQDIDLLNKSKDDDVIPVEQPPVPIIEIEDDDFEAEIPQTIIQEISTEAFMEIESNKTEYTSSTTEIEMIDSDQQKLLSFVTNDSLLVKAYEEPLEETAKLKENKENENLEDTTDEVFYNKECINYECPHKHKQFFKVPQFAFSFFKVTKKKFKIQYICADCYDKALEMFEEFCGLINAKQPLLMENIPTGRQEFVEIIDSSDDEDTNEKNKPTVSAKSAFSKNDLSLIEMELHNTIKSVLNKVEIQNQLTWSKTILTERMKRLEMETDYIDNELKSLQKKADKMHEGLYSCPKIKIRQLQPLDLNSGKAMAFDTQKEVQPIPPVGEIERPPIKINNMYYAVKNNPIASWVACKVIEQVEGGIAAQKNVKHYKIKYVKIQVQMPKNVPAKYLAYYDPPAVRLPIGTRVIAYFDATSLARGREKINVQSAFYPGIIAEPLKPNNKFRYLIFYDDGYTQYVYHKDVRLVCHVSECVWEDVHPASRDFIQKYLTQYSINRPMVQTQKGQSMNTESNGYWLHARVVDIDCSLVLMQFEGSKSHTEWIYRGSLRLGPVFKEYQKTLQKTSNMPVSRLPRRTEPFIRYTEDEENSSQQQQQRQQQHQTEKTTESNRAVARKTFGRPDSMMNSAQTSQQQLQQQQQPQTNVPAVKHLNNSTIYVEDENKPKGKVVYYTAKRNLPPRKYKPHKCSPSCLYEVTHNLSAYSPLSKPLLSGWERFVIRQKIKKVVTYRAPCGKIMRHMKELHHYLRVTNNVLNVDNFDFSHETNCLAEYVIESAIVQKRDISNGQEKMAIPLVNYYDNTLPPECKYSAKVIPTEGVHINTNPEFLIGCDCDDDCADKTKCACWQLTLTGAKYGNPNAAPEEIGYQYRRLLDHVPTGIYECNSNCKCKSSCLNRVVQNSLTMKLQVFKTSNRGWGLRCINDIPRGSFVCVYAGHLLTEAKANEGGQDAGDEYFAELDYIEVAEQIKEGYESEVDMADADEEEAYNPEGEDDDFTLSRSFITRSKQKQNATKSTRIDEDSQERQVINFNPNADMNEDSVRENSIRKLYGRDEACYVMDAKISGNLGRYFNHSCAPNMFVQNVFVDTHDLRFPHVAFFSSSNIRAGTELTWNYNYEVGVVPGKVLYCQCGAANCRLRLL